MEKQIILITGATTGIGRHAALHLARRGHRVIATGRNEKALAELAREAGDATLETVRLDVTDPKSIEAAAADVDALTSGYGVDVLVNNAGYGSAAPVVESPDAEIRGQYETNVFGLLAVTRTFAPKMMERRSGRIINVGSVGGRVTIPLLGVYNSTKYAVESLSDAMRRELRPFGIRVSIIEPGPIKTEFSNRTVVDADRYKASTSRYAKVFERADTIKRRTDEMSATADVVTRAIEKAATSRWPSHRYVVPFSSNLMIWFFAVMPVAMADWMLALVGGLRPDNVGFDRPTKPSVRPERLRTRAELAAEV